jgi:hypothetical protein
MFIGAVASALVLGYLGGLLSFKVKSRWCPECGATTTKRPPLQQTVARR